MSGANRGRIANNYGSFDVVFESGHGATLKDIDGKEYIDFVAGIAVNCLGHGYPPLAKAIAEQAARSIHVSNYYNSDKGLEYSERLLRAAGMEDVFFCNSGAEANECAIKLARKHGYLSAHGEGAGKSGAAERRAIITLEKSFHGRTLAALAATGQEAFHPECFAPYPQGFKAIRAGSYDDLQYIDKNVCAVLIEVVQGEGGVNLIDGEWARACEKKAREAGALFMVDEVQTGMGRTGELFAFMGMGLAPDVVTLAKGIAGGVPMGACLFGRRAADVFVAGDHQSTFGGNPLACAAALAVLDALEAPGFLERVRKAGERMRSAIGSWGLPCVKDVRGMGLMIGVDIEGSAAAVQKACLEASPKGLCVSTAGAHTLRVIPPLVITDAEIDEGLSALREALALTGQF